MIETPQIVDTAEQLTAYIHLTVTRDEIRDVMGPGIQELMLALADQNLAPVGPWLNHHLRMDPGIFDFEISVPVSTEIVPVGRVKPGRLPGGRVARTVYYGPYEGLGDAWGEFSEWIAANGHRAAPDLWECYVAGPETSANPQDWRTELNQPLLG